MKRPEEEVGEPHPQVRPQRRQRQAVEEVAEVAEVTEAAKNVFSDFLEHCDPGVLKI